MRIKESVCAASRALQEVATSLSWSNKNKYRWPGFKETSQLVCIITGNTTDVVSVPAPRHQRWTSTNADIIRVSTGATVRTVPTNAE
jgi:hypothetical protein